MTSGVSDMSGVMPLDDSLDSVLNLPTEKPRYAWILFFVQSRKTTFIKLKLNKSVSRLQYLKCKMLFKGNIYILKT